MDDTYDIAIVGGGIVGAATFYQLQKKFSNRKLVLIEKEDLLAKHQTGNNSGVIHSGLYYTPGSNKAINCVRGRHELVDFSKKYKVNHDVCGKVVVATEKKEIKFLDKIYTEDGGKTEIRKILQTIKNDTSESVSLNDAVQEINHADEE